jgi:hypothetical protein
MAPPTKIPLQKSIKVKVRVKGPYLSNPTININVKQSQFRGNKREIESVEETTEVRVQMKKTRK